MNFNNGTIKDTGGYLEPGEYDVFVFAFQYDQTQNGARFLRYKFKTNQGVTHTEEFYLTDKAMWKLRRLSMACGFIEKAMLEEKDLIGRKIHIKIVTRTYDKSDGSGKGYNNEITSFTKLENVQNQNSGFSGSPGQSNQNQNSFDDRYGPPIDQQPPDNYNPNFDQNNNGPVRNNNANDNSMPYMNNSNMQNPNFNNANEYNPNNSPDDPF